MNVINLTPHAICVHTEDDRNVVFPSSGIIARLESNETPTGLSGPAGAPMVRRTTGKVTGVPAPVTGTLFIVSGMVKGAMPERTDVIAPDTGATAIRFENGHIDAVTRWIV